MKTQRQRDEKRLQEVIAHVIEKCGDDIRISPAWVATGAMKEIDPKRISPPLVYLGCHLELRQLARTCLRGRFEAEDDDLPPDAQDDLFPGLQIRYPAMRSRADEEPEYILRESMSWADVEFNVRRLRAEGSAKLKHARALERWWKHRQQIA